MSAEIVYDFDVERLADAWWAGDIDRDSYVAESRLAGYAALQAEITEAIREHEIRLNRLRNLRAELRNRALKTIGDDK